MFEKRKDRIQRKEGRRRKREKKIKEARLAHGIPLTAQDSIPFERMFPGGVCRTADGYYSKSIGFKDLNYQLASREDRLIMQKQWGRLLNSFDSGTRVQITFLNRKGKKSKAVSLDPKGPQDIREEFNTLIARQMALGNKGIHKDKLLTFGVRAENLLEASRQLGRIEATVLSHFKQMGVSAKAYSGAKRLQLMHDVFHLTEETKFRFQWEWLTSSGLSDKDFIAPGSFTFKRKDRFEAGEMLGSVSMLQILTSELSDQFLKELLDQEASQVVSMHIQPVDQAVAIKKVKSTITELDRSAIEEQKRAVRSGYDMDILPADLAAYGKDAKGFLQGLMDRNEKMFYLTFLVLHTGRTEAELKANIKEARRIAEGQNMRLVTLDYQQEAALMSCLPLVSNNIGILRNMTTTALAGLVPFVTRELCQKGVGPLYYGVNALTKMPILADRKRLKNPNGLILGTSGSGKSFAAKREIAHAYFATEDDIIVCDPESEYTALTKTLGGQVIDIRAGSEQHINPMDIHGDYSEEDDPVALKAEFILSLCELIVGGREGLTAVEKTVIDRCVHRVYDRYFKDPKPERMPVLEDLYMALLTQDEKEAHHLARALEIYVKGSLSLFNHRTNVDLENRLVCFDIRGLGKQMKKLGMLIVQDQVWGRVSANRDKRRSTRYYIDEIHLLLREEQTASYSVEIWKRWRKWGGIPTGITQDIKDLLASREISAIFENSDFILMLNQRGEDRTILAEHLHISEHQLSFVTGAAEGQGLLFYGDTILPFEDQFPEDTMLYQIMTTKLSEGGGRYGTG